MHHALASRSASAASTARPATAAPSPSKVASVALPSTLRRRRHCNKPLFVASATAGGDKEPSNDKSKGDESTSSSPNADGSSSKSSSNGNAPRASSSSPPSSGGERRQRRRRRQQPVEEPVTLTTFNPVAMGRKSRQIFDDVWAQFTKLGSPLGTSYSPSAYAPSNNRRLRGTGSLEDAAAFDELAAFAAAAGEFETPEAANTRVAVIGATGRVGRVLVRKLLLRGYKVTALVRPPLGMTVPDEEGQEVATTTEGEEEEAGASTTDKKRFGSLEPSSVGLPDAVRVVWGDVGDYKALRKAVEGADKVVFAAAARTLLSADVARVDAGGVAGAAAAFQDARAAAAARRDAAESDNGSDGAVGLARHRGPARATTAKRTLFEKKNFADFVVDNCGPPPDAATSRSIRKKAASADRATLSINARQNLVFEGVVRSRGGAFAQTMAPLPSSSSSPLADSEGLVVRVAADGGSYTVVLRTAAGDSYGARVSAPLAFTNLRLPFAAFRPISPGAPPQLDPCSATHFGIRFSPPAAALAAAAGGRFNSDDDGERNSSDNNAGAFRIEIDRVKALPGGTEPDFILVSASAAGAAAVAAAAVRGGEADASSSGFDRSGSASFASSSSSSAAETATATAATTTVLSTIDEAAEDAAVAAAAERLLSSKRDGEAALRRSGLGYVVVRPGPLLEEPGGYRALVFDQGNRIARPISCADAADVCLKALHDPLARNKTFEVCYELGGGSGEGDAGVLEQYELLAHLPDKANNYLSPALAVLEKNT